MAVQERVQKNTSSAKKEDKIEEEIPQPQDKNLDKIKAEADALLDEIDEILADQGLGTTEQAEMFVNAFQQKEENRHDFIEFTEYGS